MSEILGTILLAALYFTPTLVAWGRKRPVVSIFIINLCFGWTVVGWIICLAMAFWGDNRKTAPTG